jgi:hypothetical protein
VVVVDPDRASVAVYRRGTPAAMLSEPDDLDLSDVVEGFHCQVRDLLG